ncbi:26s proteasome non-atpase regulatory subunit 14 like protein [Quercus suber]|uniref:26s proteasome non-atpase regulatory subunit 14 like protein n=1 Tax=Quercus suber TaxID=58331 RepID=A0AAW0LCF6_QUESU
MLLDTNQYVKSRSRSKSRVERKSIREILIRKKTQKRERERERNTPYMSGMERETHSDSPTLDSSEQVYISSLALLKMLKHAQSNDVVESLDKEMTEEYYKYTYFHEKKTFQVT